MLKAPLNWLDQMRRRALWAVVVVLLTAIGVIAWTTLPAWPVIGVALATTAFVLSTITKDLSQDRCLGCGSFIAQLPAGVHGRACPTCGTINERLALPTSGGPAATPKNASDDSRST
jgi:hypothetical protein